MTTKVDIKKVQNANSKAEAMDYLVPLIGYKDAEAYWKENGAKNKQRGFRAMFYAELEKHDFTAEEVKAFAEENGSPNDAKQYTHYVAIAELVAKTRK